MRLCEIIYVKHKDEQGWKWCPVPVDGEAKPSNETYPLFYECVTAARAEGYTPTLKCL
jgi:hypothetical protein